jgi:hypothetical protein
MAQAAVTGRRGRQAQDHADPAGAERAGNKDGSIPAWDGGATKAQPATRAASRGRPVPKREAELSINAKNMDQHADKLSDGVQALMKKYPDFRIDVYPTHRTAAAPQAVYDNTFKNATRAKTIEGGYGMEGAFGGVPFPIPKDGYEVIWNQRTAWRGGNYTMPARVWVVTSDGKRSMASGGIADDPPGLLRPGRQPGEVRRLLPIRQVRRQRAGLQGGRGDPGAGRCVRAAPRGLWQYLVGQRRVRKAPSVAYDTPDSVTSGIGLFDEAFTLFGPIDKHELKLVGKKEMYIPYNNNRAALRRRSTSWSRPTR